jgi:hypothetical protein
MKDRHYLLLGCAARIPEGAKGRLEHDHKVTV